MALILNIETSTTMCSVGIAENGVPVSIKEINSGYTHAENLHVYINDLLVQEKILPSQLDAIAVGSGPGSYTGLRIGVSAAKGLAYAIHKPLIAVNSLQTLSVAAVELYGDKYNYCPMLDARRMEVYCAIIDSDYSFVKETTAHIVTEGSLPFFSSDKPLCFFGDGMLKCKSILENIKGSVFIENVFPSAGLMSGLSHQKYLKGQTEDVAYYEPYYLKDFLIGPK